jgi:hypothetical protein
MHLMNSSTLPYRQVIGQLYSTHTLPPRKLPLAPFGRKVLAAGLCAVDTESVSTPEIETQVSVRLLVTTVSTVTDCVTLRQSSI